MKKVIIAFACLISALSLHAQMLNIGVLVPEESIGGIDGKVYASLGLKLERMVNSCGAASANSGNIVIFPVIDITDEKRIEGGMRNVNSVEFELVVKAVSLHNDVTFGSMTWSLKGAGYNKSEAVKDGIGKLYADDRKFSAFFYNIREKIEKYYIVNKNFLMAQAKSLAARKQYGEAIYLLYEYQQGVAGYSDVQQAIENIYKQYQTENCSQILQEAKAQYAIRDYYEAAALIADIDATSSCAPDANALSKKIRQSIDADKEEERNYELTQQKI